MKKVLFFFIYIFITNTVHAQLNIEKFVDETYKNNFKDEQTYNTKIDCSSFNVKDFGAVPNDNIDDSQAFQKIIDLGKKIFIPQGEYIISIPIFIENKQNISIVGVNNVILKLTNIYDNKIFSINKSNNILIDGIKFFGYASIENASQRAIEIGNESSNILIQNCNFDGTENSGFNYSIDIRNSKKIVIIKSLFRNLVGYRSGNGYSVHVSSTDSILIANNSFIGKQLNSRHALYLSSGAKRTKVIKNIIKDYYWEAISLNSYSYQESTTDNLIQGNMIEGGSYFLDIILGQITIYGNCHNNTISKNILIGSAQCGIVLNGSSGDNYLATKISSGNIIDGNTFINNGTRSIFLSGITHTVISNNIIVNSGYSYLTGFGYPAIYIGPNVFNGSLPASNNLKIFGNSFSGANITRTCIMIDTSYALPYNITVCNDNNFMQMRFSENEFNGVTTVTFCE